LDAERAVLSACLLKQASIDEVGELRSWHFYADQHQLLWSAIATLHGAGDAVDTVTVARQLRDRNQLERVGTHYIAEVVDATPAVLHVDRHARIVIDLERRRRLISECQRVAAEGYNAVQASWVADSIRDLSNIVEAPAPRDPWSWQNAAALAEPVGPVPWVVPGLQIGPGRPNSFQAFGGGMKTLSAMSLIVAVCAGRSVWGSFPVGQPRRVRHIDLEQGSRATRRRYQRLAFGLGVDLESLPLEVSCLPSARLTDANAREVFTGAAKDVDLVVVDSLAASLAGVNENDNAVRAYLDTLTAISEETGVAWLIIHHVGKTKDGHDDKRQRGRGASSLFDAFGAVFDFTKESEFIRYVEQTKAHLEAEGPIEHFFLEVSDVPNGTNPKAGVVVTAKTYEQVKGPGGRPASRFDVLKAAIVSLLQEGPLPSKNAIAARVTGGGKDTKLEAITELERDGKIALVGGVYRAV